MLLGLGTFDIVEELFICQMNICVSLGVNRPFGCDLSHIFISYLV